MSDLILISNAKGDLTKHAIFIHGLGGDQIKTWCPYSESQGCWLEWLSEDIKGLAVWTVKYKAAFSRWRGSAMHLTDRATNIFERFLTEPKLQTGEIVLIGHSFGGLVIKQLLRTADRMALQHTNVANFVDRVRRVAFLATPHSGADMASWAARFSFFIRPSAATACLVRNDPNLRDLNLWYRGWSTEHKVENLNLTETYPKIFFKVVKPDSSDPGLTSDPIPIDADHMTICKPRNRSSEVYIHVKKFISRNIETKSPQNQLHEDISSIKQTILDQPIKTADLVLEKILDKNIILKMPTYESLPKELIDNEIKKQLSNLRQARFFGGFSVSEHSIRLAEKIRSGEFKEGSDSVKSCALAWSARLLAYGEKSALSDEFLSLATQLGNGPEIIVAEAFRVSANGELENALSKLAGIESCFVRTAAFFIICHHKDATSSIEWLSQSGITLSELDADGKQFLIKKLLELCRWDEAFELTTDLLEEDYQQTPILLEIAAIAHLVKVVPEELKKSVLQQLPFELCTFPLASNADSLKLRKKAVYLFSKCAIAARNLGCTDAANLADDYALWLELCNPESQHSGRRKLEESLRNPAHSLRRLRFALQFGIKLELDKVEQEIQRQEVLSGGGSVDTAMARFSLAFTRENPKEFIDYIDRYRTQIYKHLNFEFVKAIEIEMLVEAGFRRRAEECLNELIEKGLSEAQKDHLIRIIAETTGDDFIETQKTQFEGSGKIVDLAKLVQLLEKKNDLPNLCHFSSLLFQKTQALTDAIRLSKALYEVNRYSDLVELLRKYPEFLDQSDDLQMIWSWALYYLGFFPESEVTLEKLRKKRDYPADRALLVNLTIAIGNWEALLPYVEQEWANREKRQADELIKTAQLAQHIGSPRAKELTYTATVKGMNNAGILAAAYILATNAGWEDEETVVQWLNNAVELSDENGPFVKKTIKNLLDQKPEWDRRVTEIWQQLSNGDLPIFAAATFVNRTLIDMILFPALANLGEQDPRRRVIIPAYSGVRHSLPCIYQVVAIDATALLTLGYLDLLKKTLEAFTFIVIPHSTLRWLFEEKQKVSFHQPSKIKDAHKLRQLIANGSLKEFNASSKIETELAAEVGEELASLILEAQSKDNGDEKQKIVIRSSPVHRISSLMEEEADLSSYYSNLCSCLSVVTKLKQKGQLTAIEERRARSYLSLHDKEWPYQPEISDNAILYLDDLSVSYLQHTGLLEKLRPAGLEAYISKQVIEEVNTLLSYEQLASKVSSVIEVIKKLLATGISGGKIKIGRMPQFDKRVDPTLIHHPSLEIIDLAVEAEAIIVDDRCLNQYENVDSGSNKTPILTTFDLINALQLRNTITRDETFDCRTKLRRAGYLFVQVKYDELQYYLSASEVVNGCLVETAELKAIRENLLRIRMTDFLKLPKEALWLNGIMQVFSQTLKAQWCPEINEETARARSEWLLRLLDVRGWATSFNNDGGLCMAEQGFAEQILLLFQMPSIIPFEIKKKYWKWLEDGVLLKLQEENPDLYSWLIKRVQELISHAVETILQRRVNSGCST